MNLYFPPELIEAIALLLPNNQQFNCLTVSKSWYESVHRALYRIIQVKHRRNFKLLLKLINCQPRYGLLVRQIYFNKSNPIVGITTQELEQLSIHCPFLEILDFDKSVWKYIKYSSVNKHQLKRIPPLNIHAPLLFLLENPFYLYRLTQLTLFGELVSRLFGHSQKRLISILSNTPELRKLTINSKQLKSHTIYVSYQLLEAIHTSLPKLMDLEIAGSFRFNVQNTDLALGLIHSTKVRRLKIKANLLLPQWIYYIARKYPLLEELDMELVASNATFFSHWIPSTEEVQQLFSMLLGYCSYLRKIQLDSATAKIYLTSAFFERSKSHNTLREIKMKSLPYNLVSRDQFFDLLVKYGQQLVTGLGTEVIGTDMHISTILAPLSSFTKLTELILCCGHPCFDCALDLLLDQCQKLKHLTIRSAHVVLQSNHDLTNNDFKQHVLQSLHLSTVSFSAQLFDYLGYRCQALNQLSFYECDQNGGLTQRIRINMPNNNFDFIIMNGIRLDSVPFQRHTWTPNARILSIETTSGIKRWYHAYNGNKLCYPEHPKIQKLNSRKTAIAEHYYQFGWINNQKYVEQAIKWEEDLFFGNIAILCRSVKRWELICNTTYNEF
ncbi:MAG: hypothetical protein EXX96DRAFT_533167 [Benjaminiella poitrasii]|nr:MAG: hypothetical protein EXX96DRAFT_533472 [Benjaminiella poitrasii]KAI9468239.1 MAG: hypothetical protein EXX96DRAFT_533167 [Benjaminiella poitrasii]